MLSNKGGKTSRKMNSVKPTSNRAINSSRQDHGHLPIISVVSSMNSVEYQDMKNNNSLGGSDSITLENTMKPSTAKKARVGERKNRINNGLSG